MALFPVSIRESDRELARKRAGKASLWHPERLADPSYDRWRTSIRSAKRLLGVQFVETGIITALGKRAMAWGEDLAAFEPGWGKLDITRRAPNETEELRHCAEFDDPGPQGVWYVTRVRYRWAFECQGKFAWIRWLVALGNRRANLQRMIERVAASFAEPLPGYNLGRIRNLRGETIELLTEVTR